MIYRNDINALKNSKSYDDRYPIFFSAFEKPSDRNELNDVNAIC